MRLCVCRLVNNKPVSAPFAKQRATTFDFGAKWNLIWTDASEIFANSRRVELRPSSYTDLEIGLVFVVEIVGLLPDVLG